MVYKVGIIGCGWIGCGISKFTSNIKADNHLQAYLDNPDTEVVAICDTDISKCNYSGAHQLQNYMNMVSPYSIYRDMIKLDSIDIVSVCTPPETHCQIVCDIAPYVKAIYCEKPIATTLNDADKMIETCHKYGVILQVNHQRRFTNPTFRFSRDLIDTGTHAFDLLRYYFGEIQSLNAKQAIFKSGFICDLEYVPTMNEHIFELSITQDRMILKGVEHLVECLIQHKESKSSGEDGRIALELALRFRDERDK